MTLDTLLVIRAQGGDRDALNDVLRHLQKPLYVHIVGVLGNPDGADDVLQDVLLIIARKLGSVREPRWARAWAYRIANREAVRAARRMRQHQEVSPEDFPDASGAEPDFDEGTRQRLPALLASLTPAARTVVRLHYLDELSIAEISEALELPVGTVKSRLAYGLRALRTSVRAG